MYSTCLFCHDKLGANEAVEHFPIGRRLAFDGGKGRLWVVCRKCERWNLSPIEERWEAIEECERAFRSTKMRVSTDEIGLARTREGLDLVRIGKPQRPEFAAWRYGDQFGRRRRRNMLRGTAVGVGLIAFPLAGMIGSAVTGIAGLSVLQFLPRVYLIMHRNRIAARVRKPDGSFMLIRHNYLDGTVLLAPTGSQPWGLRIPDPVNPGLMPTAPAKPNDRMVEMRGDAAVKAAEQLLPVMNAAGAPPPMVRTAVDLTIEYGTAESAFSSISRLGQTKSAWRVWGVGTMLNAVPEQMRLALEMLSHEESERYAMEVELETLKDAWREAEEIAAISDDMFLPASVQEKLGELKASK